MHYNNLNQRQKLAIFVAPFQSEGNLKEEHTSNILCIIINYTVLLISYSIIKDQCKRITTYADKKKE